MALALQNHAAVPQLASLSGSALQPVFLAAADKLNSNMFVQPCAAQVSGRATLQYGAAMLRGALAPSCTAAGM